ncbi:TPA: hypothetical protein ACODYX_001123 [Staphylococcus aureus]|nr:hypothetical protein [Staphylococcus argenteus]MDR7650185.1 hypothetical protein [Staphylococcus argenteus]
MDGIKANGAVRFLPLSVSKSSAHNKTYIPNDSMSVLNTVSSSLL